MPAGIQAAVVTGAVVAGVAIAVAWATSLLKPALRPPTLRKGSTIMSTTNQPSVVDADTFTVRRTIHIAAPIDKVWSAVTAPEHISQWFGKAAFDGSGRGRHGHPHLAGRRFDPGADRGHRRAAHGLLPLGQRRRSRHAPAELDDAHSTVFTFTLEAVPDGTQLTVVETGFETTSDPAANLEDHRGGWDAELDKLVALLEGGVVTTGDAGPGVRGAR